MTPRPCPMPPLPAAPPPRPCPVTPPEIPPPRPEATLPGPETPPPRPEATLAGLETPPRRPLPLDQRLGVCHAAGPVAWNGLTGRTGVKLTFTGVFGGNPDLRRWASYSATTLSRPRLLEMPPTRPPPTGPIGWDVSRPGRTAVALTVGEFPIGPAVVVDWRPISLGRIWMGAWEVSVIANDAGIQSMVNLLECERLVLRGSIQDRRRRPGFRPGCRRCWCCCCWWWRATFWWFLLLLLLLL